MLSYLTHASTHDALTGLANRRFLYQAFKDRLSAKQFNGELAGLLYLDLNDFKSVNDAYGHEMGVALLDDNNGILDDLLTRSDQEMYKEKAELKQNK